MSLASIRTKQEQCLNDIYASLENQGAVIPDKKNLVNVAPAIESIEGGGVVAYTVTFDSNGGSAVASQQIVEGYTVKEPDAPFKEGSELSYWTLNGVEYDFDTPVSSDITLVAVWKINYIPLEYLENTGTQYIDTGVVPTNKTKWVLDYQFLADTNINGEETAQNGCGFWSDSERFVIGYGGGQLNVAIGVNGISTVNGDTARHTFILDVPNKKGYVDNNVISCNYTSFAGKESICIFNRKENGNTSKYIHCGRLYGSSIYENGVLIRDYIPALNPENVACLYDKITKTFLYNAGTGSFTAGSVIS